MEKIDSVGGKKAILIQIRIHGVCKSWGTSQKTIVIKTYVPDIHSFRYDVHQWQGEGYGRVDSSYFLRNSVLINFRNALVIL